MTGAEGMERSYIWVTGVWGVTGRLGFIYYTGYIVPGTLIIHINSTLRTHINSTLRTPHKLLQMFSLVGSRDP